MSSIPQKAPGATPPILTPGGRRLPPISYSPENITTPGGTLWNSLLTATNPDQPSIQRSSNNPPPNGASALNNTGPPHTQNPDYSQFLNGSRKSGLTPNESNIRTGLTPGVSTATNGHGFPFGNQMISLTPGILNSPMTPGLSTLLGLGHNPAIMTPQLQQHIQNQPPHIQQQVQQQLQVQAVQPQVQTMVQTSDLGLPSTNQQKSRDHTESELETKKPRKLRKVKAEAANEEESSSTTIKSASPEDKKPSTENEKRQHFLERNRLAASKCRQRKKEKVAKMEDELKFYSSGYLRLSGQVNQLNAQLVQVRDILQNHKTCPLLNQQVGSYNQLTNLLNQVNYIISSEKPSSEIISNPPTVAGFQPLQPVQEYIPTISNNITPTLQAASTNNTSSGESSSIAVANEYETISGSNNISEHPSTSEVPGSAEVHQLQSQPSDIRAIHSMSNLALPITHNVVDHTNSDFNLRLVNSMVNIHHQNNNLVDLPN